jgi:hypothetical protein
MSARCIRAIKTPPNKKLKEDYLQVLCASTDGAVEPLAVPEGVPNGERVMVAGHDAAPEPQLPPKKKIWEALMPDLATSAGMILHLASSTLACIEVMCWA